MTGATLIEISQIMEPQCPIGGGTEEFLHIFCGLEGFFECAWPLQTTGFYAFAASGKCVGKCCV